VASDREHLAELIVNYVPSDRYQIASAIAAMILDQTTAPLSPTEQSREGDYAEFVRVLTDTLRYERYETLWAQAYREMR
jgi:hypothetical protein